ncbi:MAG: HEAT repeat domain-containing protein [Spirulina sp. SIO3F2]|nr:HEAT repeat domain-containing protein [Spirulina sp. SIO3F2]
MLQYAQEAATQQNWSQVTQLLRHCTAQLEQASATEQEQALDLALDALLWGDFQDRWELVKVLPHLGMPAFEALTHLLLDEAMTFEIRWFAARILGAFQDPIAVEPLVQCLQSADDPEVVQVAALALASLGEVAIAPLAQALADPAQCVMAVQALTQIHHPAIVEPLLSVVEHPDPALRAQIIEALSNFQQPRLVPILVQALQDPHAMVRKEAVTGLGLWTTSQRANLTHSMDLFALLQSCLHDLNLEVCQQAAIALGRLATPAAATALFEVIQKETTPPPLQRDSIRALGRIESSQTLSYFQAVLPQISPMAQVETIRALGRWETIELKPSATQILLDFFAVADELAIVVQQELTQAWAHLQSSLAIPTLQQLTQSDIETVRLHAIAALKQLSGSDL